MKPYKQIITFITNITKFQILLIDDHRVKPVSRIDSKLYLLFCCICLLSLGGMIKSIACFTNQLKIAIVANYQQGKNDHYNSLVNVLNLLVNQSVSLIHGLPADAVNISGVKIKFPELISNSSLFPLIGSNSADYQRLNNYLFQTRFTPQPLSRHRTTSDLLRFDCPSEGRITSHFGKRTDPVYEGTAIHYGIDIASRIGTPIMAAADGAVKFAGNKSRWGNVIIIDHTKGYQTIYAHLHRFGIVNGDTVSRGQVIGYLGNSGKSTGPHLHFEVRYFGKPLNPLPFLLPVDTIAD